MMKTLAVLAGTAVLAGCASFHALSNDVSSYSRWPAGRTPRTYAFDRLPSQQTQVKETQSLEDAARPSIEAAGFVAVAEGATPDVTVQLGARITATERSVFDDPFWYGPYGAWHRPFGPRSFGFGAYGGWGYGWGPGGGLYGFGGPGYYGGFPVYEREVGILIRDKRSGEALYESRAVSDGSAGSTKAILPAMFSAVLRDFPAGSSENPHRVVVDTRRP